MVEKITERTMIPLFVVAVLFSGTVSITAYITSVNAKAQVAATTADEAIAMVKSSRADMQQLAERIASMEGKLNLLILKEDRK